MNQVNEVVSASAIAGMVLSIIVTLLGPVLLLLIWRLKKKCSLIPALAGAITFIVAALILENIPKYVLFSGSNPVSTYVLKHAWAFALAGGLLAGIFEECGRYITFRFLLKRHNNKETAITYGIGHGGIECILLVGITMLSNLILAFLINSGSMSLMVNAASAGTEASYNTIISTLTATSFSTFLWGTWERIFAVILHISLSVLVFTSVKNKSRFYFFPIAIFLHTLIDIPAALFQFGVLSLIPVELLTALIAAGVAIFAHRIYKNLTQ